MKNLNLLSVFNAIVVVLIAKAANGMIYRIKAHQKVFGGVGF